MTAEGFDRALKQILIHEGGNDDDPRDPGGRTSQGIIQREYTAYRRRKNLEARDVWQISPEERDEIYRLQYWDKIRGNDLPPGVDYAVFDGAVNSGVRQSVKWLQRALGAVNVDGVLGEATLDVTERYPDHDQLIAAMEARRLIFLRELKTFTTYGKGWTGRVADVKATGQAWAMGSEGPTVVYIPGAHKKASIDDAKSAPVRAVADATSGGGVAMAAISQATTTLVPLASDNHAIAGIVGTLTALGVGITLCGVAYGAWARTRATALHDALDIQGATS